MRLQPLAKHLAAMFDVMLRFRAFADRLCDAVAQAGARRVVAQARAAENTAQGRWGSTGGAEVRDMRDMPPAPCPLMPCTLLPHSLLYDPAHRTPTIPYPMYPES